MHGEASPPFDGEEAGLAKKTTRKIIYSICIDDILGHPGTVLCSPGHIYIPQKKRIMIDLFTVQLFRVLDVRIALVEVITWTKADQINIVPGPIDLLNNFQGYKRQLSTQHDALMLLT